MPVLLTSTSTPPKRSIAVSIRRCATRPELTSPATIRLRSPEPHLIAWRALLNAQAALVGKVEEALGEASLPPLSWYDVLWAIRRAPGRRIRMAELANSLTISRGGLTKLFDRLESSGTTTGGVRRITSAS